MFTFDSLVSFHCSVFSLATELTANNNFVFHHKCAKLTVWLVGSEYSYIRPILLLFFKV